MELAARVESVPLPLEPGEHVASAATFTFHSAAITDGGRLLLWGDNSHGQLGIEASNKSEVGVSLRAVPLSGGTFASAVALGEHHTVVLTNASELLTFGHNERGQLGRMRGTTYDSFPAEAAWRGNANAHAAAAVPPAAPLAVAASAFFSAALDAAGHIFVWGDLPVARRTDRPQRRAGRAARSSAGSVSPAAGSGEEGEEEEEADADAADEEAVRVVEVGGGAAVRSVCLGGFHAVATTADGASWSWGENAVGQLCRRTESDVDVEPAQLKLEVPGGELSQAALGAGRVVLGCGGFHSLLGLAAAPDAPPTVVLGCGEGHEARRGADGGMVAGGGGGGAAGRRRGRGGGRLVYDEETGEYEEGEEFGDEGDEEGVGDDEVGAPLRVELPGLLPTDELVALEAGHMHSVARTRHGRLFAWGGNEYGQLGWAPPGPLPRPGATFAPREVLFSEMGVKGGGPAASTAGVSVQVVGVAVGAYHTLALTADGAVFSWGSNSHGQLGRATASYHEAQPRALRLPGSRAGARALGAAAGAFHSVVRLDGLDGRGGGEVCAFGDNGHGQQGRRAPRRADACGVARGVSQLAAGELHTVALGRGGAVLTWGDNQRGQCGRHPEMPLLPRPGRAVLPLLEGEVAVQVAAGGYRSAVISSTGRLLVLGLTEVDLTAEEMEMESGRGYPYAGEGEAEEDADGASDGAEPGAWGARGGWVSAAGGGATRRGGGGGGGGGRKRREPTVWQSREIE